MGDDSIHLANYTKSDSKIYTFYAEHESIAQDDPATIITYKYIHFFYPEKVKKYV